MSTDLLSNMISSLKNTALAKNKYIEVVHSKECEQVAKVLKERGFLEDIKVFKPSSYPGKMIRMDLAFEQDKPIIRDARRISKPGRRLYRKAGELNAVKGGMGVLVVSTSRGVMDGLEARRKKLGGELVCEVY